MATAETTDTLETQLSKIRAARFSGARTVQFADRSVTYASAAELAAAESHILRKLSARPKVSLLVASKGTL